MFRAVFFILFWAGCAGAPEPRPEQPEPPPADAEEPQAAPHVDEGEALRIDVPPEGALTQEQLDAIAQDIARLRAHPFAPDHEEAEGNLLLWLLSSPDVSVLMCGLPSDVVGDETHPLGGTLLAHFTLAMAESIVRNGGSEDHRANHLAGLEAVRRVYEEGLERLGEGGRNGELDQLLGAADLGERAAAMARGCEDRSDEQ